MKKNFIKVMVFMLIISMVVLPAAMSATARASYYIDNCNTTVYALGNGDLQIDFHISGTGLMTSIGATRIDLKNSSGLTIKSFISTNPVYANMMASNKYVYASSVTYTVTPGSYYYAVAYFYAGNSTGSDTTTYVTASVKA